MLTKHQEFSKKTVEIFLERDSKGGVFRVYCLINIYTKKAWQAVKRAVIGLASCEECWLHVEDCSTWVQIAEEGILAAILRDRENLGEYWERFKKLCASYPQLQMEDFILSFYERLSLTDRSWADAANEGSFLDRSPEDVIDLIERKTVDNQQFETTGVHEIGTNPVKVINERIYVLEKKLDEIELSQAFVANMFGGNRYQQNKQPYVPPKVDKLEARESSKLPTQTMIKP
ncbi:hypothetical protein V8G54_024107 [Vigna mungo]|uniref:Retrotransposon gag domain-containing protein n=1 Tax=Vigna mungo TaxID=3915 RepID=A0AAQ3RT60_VIGMU